MHFDRISPSAVRSVRQQDFLKVWLRLYSQTGQLPVLSTFEPSRFDNEKPELMIYDVVHKDSDIRYPATFAGDRLIEAYGFSAVGHDLQDILSPMVWKHVEPLYDTCVTRGMPVYSAFTVTDLAGSAVTYERLLLPFGENGVVQQMMASIKSISEDGRFVNSLLMRPSGHDPQYSIRGIVDHDAPPLQPAQASNADDVIEI
ncbi:MAG: hypothetical protein A4S14_10735 [Proteobacteria bacterium SG_bin9]|nr:MAG: hypothetical protein A4S14_10735 [Proteobacteria bacterium SG_bin9]